MARTAGKSEPSLSQERIAHRAYALYVQSGRLPGRDLDNWLEAEAQLLTAPARATHRGVVPGLTPSAPVLPWP